MGEELKSTLDLVMEKYGSQADPQKLTEAQKQEIAEIRKVYQAKMAEARILLAGDENLAREVGRLQRQMEQEIEKAKQSS